MACATILLQNRTEELVRLSLFITGFCEQKGLSTDLELALNLVAEEAFMNVVMHGHAQEGGHEIGVTLTHRGHQVELTVEDDATEFNPLNAAEVDPDASLDQRRIGGLGIHLLRKLMTELHYERSGGKNRLTMRKLIPLN
jgi:anti-sigma regulatory factor (Ser/Thr protein kinase)